MPKFCHCDICNEPGPTDEPEDEMDATDPAAVEQALAWADNCNPPDRTIDEQRDVSAAIHTLAAAVREAQARLNTSLDIQHVAREYAHEQNQRAECAEAELAALKARTCGTCRDSVEGSSGTRFCIGPGHGVACEEFGNTCGAWAAKEGDHGVQGQRQVAEEGGTR
jgi:hypothetical protein